MENYQNRTQLGTLILEVLIGNAPVRDLLDMKYKKARPKTPETRQKSITRKPERKALHRTNSGKTKLHSCKP
jgi:hypothetical protein